MKEITVDAVFALASTRVQGAGKYTSVIRGEKKTGTANGTAVICTKSPSLTEPNHPPTPLPSAQSCVWDHT